MRFIHFADTHLGFSDLAKIDPASGVNRREQDFYDAWQHVIAAIVERRPDFVLHAGDLFQSPRPNNRAIAVALEGIKKLHDAGIPLYAVAGNHSTPRIRATGSIFEALAILPNVHAAYSGVYEKFVFTSKNGRERCAIHCLPHCSLSADLEKAYAQLQCDASARWNILLAHGSWRAAGRIDTRMGEFNEQFLEDPETRLNLAFDYIALGHYHRHLALNDHAFYSGSTERTSFNEAGYPSGYICGDLQARTWEYVRIPSRPMLRLPPVDCRNRSVEEVMLALKERSSADLAGAMVALEFRHLARDLYLQLDASAIDKIFAQVFHLDKQFVFEDETARAAAGQASSEIMALGSLREEFSRHLLQRSNGTLPREELERLGWEYLAAAETAGLEA